jgi:hypothetical protein
MSDQSPVSNSSTSNTSAGQGITTLGLNQSGTPARWDHAETYRVQMRSGARWFYWIAGLSLINTIAAFTNSNWSFLAGLGITQFVYGIALGLSESVGGVITIIALVLNVLVAGFFIFLGVFANKGYTWAFIIGLIVYALDGLIFLAFQMWFPLAFHVFVCWCLYKGLSANRSVKKVEAEIAATSTPATTQLQN